MNQKKFIECRLPVDMLAGSVIFVDPITGKPFTELSKTRVLRKEHVFTKTQRGVLKVLEGGRKTLIELQNACRKERVPIYNTDTQAKALMKRRCITRRKGRNSRGRPAYVYSITRVGRKVLEETDRQ